MPEARRWQKDYVAARKQGREEKRPLVVFIGVATVIGLVLLAVAFLVAYTSRFMTLLPGDVISTGTPAGVGLGMKPNLYLIPGIAATHVPNKRLDDANKNPTASTGFSFIKDEMFLIISYKPQALSSRFLVNRITERYSESRR